ncbi:SDR family NAD(P)-dependent oxidoreductase [Paenibacillus hodogayensis]|uniref:SDR family NAD(P)-dependent oxidoreductase n=1 Tax=Paenibacillus hodogayensis TaxID=279208 RepID=A0ABV5VWV5_9BACL
MKEKIVVITGANSGIGKAAALKFAAEGYRVVMACRNLTISKAAQQEIIGVTDRAQVDLMELDVSSFASIRSFRATFKAKYPYLDILIHNAAYLNHGEKAYKLSPEHIELSFATNAFGPYLLTHLLADHLAKSEDPRVLNACTTNIKHFFDPKRNIEFDNLRGEYRETRPYSVYKMYGDSKMAFLMLTFKMAEQFKSQGIKVNALQINRVKLSKETIQKMSPMFRMLAKLQNFTNPLPTGMADNYYQLCTSQDYKHATGLLFNHKREVVQPSISEKGFAQLKNIFGSRNYPQYAIDPIQVAKLWDLCTELTAED